MAAYTEDQIAAALLTLSPRSRSRVITKILNSLKSDDETDAAWIEELQWRLKDWRAGLRLEAVDDLLDDPDALLTGSALARGKTFDAVQMMRDIREKMSREMEGMTAEEELAYINEGVRRSREKRVDGDCNG